MQTTPTVIYRSYELAARMSFNRSYMFVSGSDQRAVIDAMESVADVAIIDLEDTVSPEAKETARASTLETLDDMGETGDSRAIRVNGLDTERGIEDIREIATAEILPDELLLPDIRDATEIRIVDDILDDYGLDLEIHPLIEKPSTLLQARDVARASDRVNAMMFAAIDFQMNMGMSILDETDLSVPRFLLSMAASGAGVQAIDKPNLAAVDDPERTRTEAKAAKSIGFDGKAAMTPDQAAIINDVFTPSDEEIERAKRFIEAFEETDAGVTVIEGAAVDKPVVDQLRQLLKRARRAGADV